MCGNKFNRLSGSEIVHLLHIQTLHLVQPLHIYIHIHPIVRRCHLKRASSVSPVPFSIPKSPPIRCLLILSIYKPSGSGLYTVWVWFAESAKNPSKPNSVCIYGLCLNECDNKHTILTMSKFAPRGVESLAQRQRRPSSTGGTVAIIIWWRQYEVPRVV